MKIGFIGSSEVSRFHIDALRNNEFDIKAIGTRIKSSNCKDFAKSLNLFEKFCIGGWQEVLSKDVDAFCLCIDTLETPKILKEILELGKPVLVEKPISLYKEDFEYLINHPMKDKIFVAYNRRFYKTINIVKSKCDNSTKGGTVIVNIPDSISGYKNFLSNGCHMIDSLRYILGDFEIVQKIINFEKDNLDFYAISALCKNKKWSILLNAHSKIPYNFSITVNNEDLVYELKPLEKLTIYKGIKVVEPTPEKPIISYVPIIKECLIESADLKPGFDRMYINFAKFIKNQKTDMCDINDAAKTIKLCWDLIGK